jgi:hypothetical protein
MEGTAITLAFTETYLGGQMGCKLYGGGPDSGELYPGPTVSAKPLKWKPHLTL